MWGGGEVGNFINACYSVLFLIVFVRNIPLINIFLPIYILSNYVTFYDSMTENNSTELINKYKIKKEIHFGVTTIY